MFRGFTEGGLEFHADLALPYKSEFQCTPMHGQFVLVQLETPDEAVLGRITSISAEGRLVSPTGEDFSIRAVREDQRVPEDIREQYLKYKINIRVLGALKRKDLRLVFIPSQRRLPHLGSPVAFPSGAVLRELAGHNDGGVEFGHFALGEFVYAAGAKGFRPEDWMHVLSPDIVVKFDVRSLVARRTFVFARAGYGKSNLNKFLFSSLYATTPMVQKRRQQIPAGTIVFDPEGEYFWPDDKGRPGLCDVPHLARQLVVFTPRQAPSPFYGSFVAGAVRLDLRRLRPGDVISIAIPQEKQDQQNIRKLRGLDQGRWSRLVELIDEHGNNADLEEIADILNLVADRQDIEALAARANVTSIVRMLHDKRSQFLDLLLRALAEGKLCVVDVSQMRGQQALIFSGIVLRRIFDRNQEEFTEAQPKTIPTIAVIEEAQAVLGEGRTGAEPYITWVKEGRKYDLGAVMITQQPGSIPVEILSQGDNWFIFHLLSSTDLQNVRRANAHFSEDILSILLNEPIPGQGVFWSSVGGRPYPISVRVASFEAQYPVQDPEYDRSSIDTYAAALRKEFESALRLAVGTPAEGPEAAVARPSGVAIEEPVDGSGDPLAAFKHRATAGLRAKEDVMQRLHTASVAWGELKAHLLKLLPENLDDREQLAYNLVKEFLDEDLVGGWESFRNERGAMHVRCKS